MAEWALVNFRAGFEFPLTTLSGSPHSLLFVRTVHFLFLEFAEWDLRAMPDGWTTVEVKASSLNHHDLWSLRGVGLARRRCR